MAKRLLGMSGAVLALTILLFPGASRAQFNASLSGTVLDATQAAIPGATVTLTNQQDQAVSTTQSSGEGFFRFG